jgi:hypothetical protein
MPARLGVFCHACNVNPEMPTCFAAASAANPCPRNRDTNANALARIAEV